MSRRYRKPDEGLMSANNQQPLYGTFTPPAVYRVPGEDADIEQVLQDEQEAIAVLVEDAVRALGGGGLPPAKEALRRRTEKLTLAARITARVLTKLWLNSKYPAKRS